MAPVRINAAKGTPIHQEIFRFHQADFLVGTVTGVVGLFKRGWGPSEAEAKGDFSRHRGEGSAGGCAGGMASESFCVLHGEGDFFFDRFFCLWAGEVAAVGLGWAGGRRGRFLGRLTKKR